MKKSAISALILAGTVAAVIIGVAATRKQGSTKSQCELNADKTKATFLDSCSGTLAYNDLSGNGQINRDKNREVCRCVATRFDVERLASPPDCKFDPQDVWGILGQDSVRLACR